MSTHTRITARKRSRKTSTAASKQGQQSFFENGAGETFFAPRISTTDLQRKCDGCRKENDQIDVDKYVAKLSGKGKALPEKTRRFFERRLKADLGEVRVHTDEEAAQAASAIRAKAFAFRNHIVFSSGKYSPDSAEGQQLLAHELVHVIQQNGGLSRVEVEHPEKEKLQREPDFGGVYSGRYSYSTHCGWIDWGHANPSLARNLIAVIREASKRLERRDEKLQKNIAMEMPAFVTQDVCPRRYEPGERRSSSSDTPVEKIIDTPSLATEIRMGGLEVGSADVSKFSHALKVHAWWAANVSAVRGVPVEMRIGGMTDCIDGVSVNTALRLGRAAAAFVEMQKHNPWKPFIFSPIAIPLNQFIADNSTKEGRSLNRGVIIQLIPHAAAEVLETPAMSSSHLGLTFSEVTPKVAVRKTLTEAEVLAAALTTFMVQSQYFEAAQDWTDFLGGSSFSEEDLVSNLIGFYRAAQGYAVNEVKDVCEVWDAPRSLQKLLNYSFRKNKTFRPLSLPPGGTWPVDFTVIKPMPLDADNFSILSLFIRPDFAAPGNCKINADGLITC
jgi:hypothetical protein